MKRSGWAASSTVARWYNGEHGHSGIGFHTPADSHYGHAEFVRARRAEVLTAAYTQHPERFARKPPAPPALPSAVWITEPKETTATTQCFPRNAASERLTRAGPRPYPRFVAAVPTATRPVLIFVAEATRLQDETSGNVVAVRSETSAG